MRTYRYNMWGDKETHFAKYQRKNGLAIQIKSFDLYKLLTDITWGKVKIRSNEKELLILLTLGYNNKAIRDMLGISVRALILRKNRLKKKLIKIRDNVEFDFSSFDSKLCD